MYAVIESGGKQHRVEVGGIVRVERLGVDTGESVIFDRVLMIDDGKEVRVGSPTVTGAEVRGTVVDLVRGDKIVTYTFKRRQNSNRKRRGHRQNYANVKIDAIRG